MTVAARPPRPASPRPPRPATVTGAVGRASERARLTALLDAPAGTALLVGEPGIGKTWLTDQLAEEATRKGYVVARGRVLAGRRRPAAVAVARCAPRTAARATPTSRAWPASSTKLPTRVRRARPSRPPTGSRGPCSRWPSGRRSWWSSTTSTGPTTRPCARCATCSPRPRRTPASSSSPPGARTPSRRVRWPRSARLSPAATRSGSTSTVSVRTRRGCWCGLSPVPRSRTPPPMPGTAEPPATRSSSSSWPGWTRRTWPRSPPRCATSSRAGWPCSTTGPSTRCAWQRSRAGGSRR